jgi:hypothetical protein
MAELGAVVCKPSDLPNIEYADPHITQKPIIAAYPAVTLFI